MPNVQMPDGSVVAFPDSMSEDQINSALAGWKAGSAPNSNQNNSWSRLPEMAGSALVKGTAALAGVPGDLQQLAGAGENWLSGGKLQAGLDALPGPLKGRGFQLPTSNDLLGETSKLGLTDRPDLTPTTPTERYGTAGIEAVPAIAATVLSGGADLLPAAASGLTSAVASQAAHDLAPESTWAPVAAGLATGIGTGAVVNKVDNVLTGLSASKSLESAAQQLEDAKAAATAASEAKFQGGKSLKDSLADVRAASQRDFDMTKNQLDSDLTAHHEQQDNTIGQIAAQHGTSTTLQEAGESLQSHARDWLSNVLPSKLDAAWAPVAAAIPKTMNLGLDQFQSALDGINKSAGELEPLAALLKPSLPAKLGAKLQAKNDLGELGLDGPSSAAQGQYTWGDVSKLRSALGDAMSNPKTVSDIGDKNISRLYAALTTDMRVGADKAGVTGLFDAANQESTRLYQLAEGPMAKVVSGARASADDPAPEAVARSLLAGGKSGASNLAALRQEIPQGVNELTAAQLRQNPGGFAKLAPEAQAALVADPDHTATVLGALDAKDQATAARAAGLKLAQQNRAENIAAVQKAQSEGTFAHASAVRNSSQALAAAKQSHAEAQATVAAHAAANSAPPIPGTHGMLGSMIGGAAGVVLPHMLGVSGNDLYHGAVGDIVGAAAPYLYQGGKNMIKNPGRLVLPALGAEQGANQLAP